MITCWDFGERYEVTSHSFTERAHQGAENSVLKNKIFAESTADENRQYKAAYAPSDGMLPIEVFQVRRTSMVLIEEEA